MKVKMHGYTANYANPSPKLCATIKASFLPLFMDHLIDIAKELVAGLMVSAIAALIFDEMQEGVLKKQYFPFGQKTHSLALKTV